jgi:hypothetical protein
MTGRDPLASLDAAREIASLASALTVVTDAARILRSDQKSLIRKVRLLTVADQLVAAISASVAGALPEPLPAPPALPVPEPVVAPEPSARRRYRRSK